jgi:AcrR family transcriptional regulator
MTNAVEKPVTRRERRQMQNREALIAAGYTVISEKGIDAATMGEIAELADVGSGTVYNYFGSKDDLVIAVMERVMHRLAERIEAITNTLEEPALHYAFGVRCVLLATIEDPRWKGLLSRSEVISDAMFRVMGPFALKDLEDARRAGSYDVSNATLVWRMATHAITGFGLAVSKGLIDAASIDEAVVSLLGMVGVRRSEAIKMVYRTWPELPPE